MEGINSLTQTFTLHPEKLQVRLHKLEDRFIQVDDKLTPRINWLSLGLGAEIIPSLCSPAKNLTKLIRYTAAAPTPTWWWHPWRKPDAVTIPEAIRRLTEPPSPEAALTLSTEPTVTFCGPPHHGKLQLAARLPKPIIPTELIIQHWHKEEVPQVGNAPKEIELWVKVPDEAEYAIGVQIQSLMMQRYGPDIIDNTSTRPQGRSLSSQELELIYPWIPVGRWTYDIHHPTSSNEQTFFMPLDLESYNLTVRDVVVRVNSNWGNVTNSCLVRVRLHGLDPSEIGGDDERKQRRGPSEPIWHFADVILGEEEESVVPQQSFHGGECDDGREE